MLSLLLAVSTPNTNILTCSEYTWLVEGLEEVQYLSQKEMAELHLEFIRATDPKCFDD